MMEFVSIIIATLGVAIAMVALIFAWKHERDMRDQLESLSKLAVELNSQVEEAKEHTGVLNEIRRTTLTRYLGPFPEYFPKLTKLLSEAKKSIEILCDFPGYGIFTCPNDFIDYRQVLEKAAKRFAVDITILSEERRKRLVEEQFPKKQEEFKKLLEGNDFAESVKDLLKRSGKTIDPAMLSLTEFRELLELEDKKIIRDYFPPNVFFEIESSLPIYFWIIDGSEAIFSIAVLADDVAEYGFTTIDPQFIKAFRNMKARYKHVASVPRQVPAEQ